MTERNEADTEIATLAGGCFWCLEAVFQMIRGVQGVVSGYIGGHVPNPTYEAICTGRTGHAEAVQIAFDPSVISYEEILGLFFDYHDPTTIDRQGPDTGPQYRSVVFFHTAEQKQAAETAIARLDASGVLPSPVVTEVAPLAEFYAAEDHHQNYYRNNSGAGYCQVIIAPKVAKLRKERLSALRT
jgi:peptide-methionine (S)-S-oxide reductase